MTRRARYHKVDTEIEKFDKIMKRRLNVGTGRKDRKKAIAMFKIYERE